MAVRFRGYIVSCIWTMAETERRDLGSAFCALRVVCDDEFHEDVDNGNGEDEEGERNASGQPAQHSGDAIGLFAEHGHQRHEPKLDASSVTQTPCNE